MWQPGSRSGHPGQYCCYSTAGLDPGPGISHVGSGPLSSPESHSAVRAGCSLSWLLPASRPLGSSFSMRCRNLAFAILDIILPPSTTAMASLANRINKSFSEDAEASISTISTPRPVWAHKVVPFSSCISREAMITVGMCRDPRCAATHNGRALRSSCKSRS